MHLIAVSLRLCLKQRFGQLFPLLVFLPENIRKRGKKKENRAASWSFLKALQATANACSSVFQDTLFFWRLQDAQETGPCLGLLHKHVVHSSCCLSWELFSFFSSRNAAELLCSTCPMTCSPLPSKGIGQHAALFWHIAQCRQQKGRAHFPPPSAASFPAAPAQPPRYHRTRCLAASSSRITRPKDIR